LQDSREILKFAAEKKRKGQDMVYFGIIITGCIIGLVVGLMSKQEQPKKPWKPKKKNFFVRWGETGCKYYW